MTFGRMGVLALALSACSSGDPILAAEGGAVTSDDGAFTLVIPPGALPRDTVVTVRELAEEAWPVHAPGRFTRVGAVYQVEPAGLELIEDAYAIVLADPSELLVSSEGDLLAMAYQWSPRDSKVRPAPVSRTVHLADGRSAVVATLYELGTHWVGDRVAGADRALSMLRVRAAATAGDHVTGDEWRPDALALESEMAHTLFSRDVIAAVVSREAESALTVTGTQPVRSWDARIDPELGMHAWEVFAIEGARIEHRVSERSVQPVTLQPGVPLDPLIDPLPGWRCDGAGEGELWIGVDVVTGASDGVVTVGVARAVGDARCR